MAISRLDAAVIMFDKLRVLAEEKRRGLCG
jgi:hypothetical protein